MKSIETSALDNLLREADDPNAWRTIKDIKNNREIVLSDADLEVIRRIRNRMIPNKEFDFERDAYFEFDDPDSIHPMRKDHAPKRRFIPSKWEGMRIARLVKLIRSGRVRAPIKKKPSITDVWGADVTSLTSATKVSGPDPVPAPKMAPPGHAESYNPPEEYLLTAEELKEWENADPEDRHTNFIPQKYKSLRLVPAYKNLVMERFERALDLYLCPRVMKTRLNIDPDSMLPELPSAKDLKPYPTKVAVEFIGHRDAVRAISVSACGQWLASVSEDGSARMWEVSTGRCVRALNLTTEDLKRNREDVIRAQRGGEIPQEALNPETGELVPSFANGLVATAISWNPVLPILAVAFQETVVFFLAPDAADESTLNFLTTQRDAREGAVDDDDASESHPLARALKALSIQRPDDEEPEAPEATKQRVAWREIARQDGLFKLGGRVAVSHPTRVSQLAWHRKGEYVSAVCSGAPSPSDQCTIHAISRRTSAKPFKKAQGGASVQRVAFHPSKPWFVCATQKSIRIFDLQSHNLVKSLKTGMQWVSCLSVHPSGTHIFAGSFDRKCCWFDLELSAKPFKVMRYHDRPVRQVAFHPQLNLLASCADDGRADIIHQRVYDDLITNPMIIPVKSLKGGHHVAKGQFGILDCAWHPSEAWLFTAGADGKLLLWA